MRRAISRRAIEEGIGNADIRPVTLLSRDEEVMLRVAAADQKRLSKDAIKRVSDAELSGAKSGAHQFRHSIATSLLCGGSSLSEIAELLRHRSIDCTTIYAKVDLPSLRTLALPWPGGDK